MRRVKRNGNKLSVKAAVLTTLGFAFSGLGAVGVIIPVMPTTPFVLLAACCFSAGNSKLSARIRQNRVFGPYIENYHTKQGISRQLKIASIIFVWMGLIVSMAIVRTRWIYVLLGIVGACVTIHLLMIKTKK